MPLFENPGEKVHNENREMEDVILTCSLSSFKNFTQLRIMRIIEVSINCIRSNFDNEYFISFQSASGFLEFKILLNDSYV